MISDAWLTLLQAAEPADPRWSALLSAMGTPEKLLALRPDQLIERGLTPAAVERFKRADSAVTARWRTWLEHPQHALILLGTPQYPRLLAELPNPPLALWADGTRQDLLDTAQVAIVGSRNPTRNGRDMAASIARYLSQRGITVTSGLAAGIDGASHRGALEGEGRTVAVLGSAIDRIYPRAHEPLARDIVSRGVIVSEYGPGAPTQAYQFPVRNRIIAGLSLGTLVVEASVRSGSLITARHANEYGRDVFAVPGSIHNPLARGCHKLIRDGAKLVEEGADVLVELAPQLDLDRAAIERSRERAPTAEPGLAATPEYAQLLEQLGHDPIPIAELARRSDLTTGELSSMLLLLELEGFVEALPGGRYSRIAKRGP